MEARIVAEKRPTGKAGVHTALEPFERGFEAAKQGKNARDLIRSVVRVAECFGIGAGAIHAAKSLLRIPGACAIDALQADDHGIVRKEGGGFFQERLRPAPIAGEDGRLRGEIDSVFI